MRTIQKADLASQFAPAVRRVTVSPVCHGICLPSSASRSKFSSHPTAIAGSIWSKCVEDFVIMVATGGFEPPTVPL